MRGAWELAPVGRLTRWRHALFALERQPLDLRLAARGTLGLMVPLLLGQALAWPSLDVIAFAAFLLAFGDLAEDRGWLLRLAAGSVFGGLAVATGALVGGHPLSATIGMLVWGVALGLAGAYGDGAAAMALPVAWMLLELGLSAPSHTLAEAARLGALLLLSGAWAIALGWAIKAIGPDRPLAAATARCFGVLADYLDDVLGDEPSPPVEARAATDRYGPSRETRVRATIAEARFLAVEARRRQVSASPEGQRLVVLIELADQIFSVGAVLAEAREQEARSPRAPVKDFETREESAAHCRTVFVAASRAVAHLLVRHEDRDTTSRIDAELARFRASSPPLSDANALGPAIATEGASAAASRDTDREEIRARVAVALAHALHLATGHVRGGEEVAHPGVPPAPELVPSPRPSLRQGPARFLTPLRNCLDRRSVVGRHALRYGLVTAAGVAIDKSLGVPFGYWIPLTVTVVLKPYAGSTFTRAGQRLCGTVSGVTVGVLLLHLLTAPLARIALTTTAFFATIAVLPLNYSLVVFFLSIGVVPFEGMLGSETSWDVGMLRVVNTCVGGALALAGGFLLWPSFERKSLPALISAAMSSIALYADRVLAVPAGASPSPALVEAARRQAGLDNTNLQASFQRVAVEPGESRDRLEASLLAMVTLQRLLVSLNALWRIGPDVAPGPLDWTRFRELVSRGLTALPSALESRSRPIPMSDLVGEARRISSRLVARAGRYDVFLAQEVERLAWQVSTLRTAVGRIGAAGP
jgi:uncharacterized membrane protein YccC